MNFIKRIYIFLFFLTCSGYSFSQERLDGEKVYIVVPEMPAFHGGEEELFKYLSKIKYPVTLKTENLLGHQIIISYIIDKNGDVRNPKVIKSICESVDEVVLEAVKTMPKWTPGKFEGRTVNVRLQLPIILEFR